MASPEATPLARDSAVGPVERIERKFFITPGRSGFAYGLLRQMCRPDAQYPQGRINTLYFDTPDLDQHTRSSTGDFRKDKVRIRWYDAPREDADSVPVYVELKSRRGFATSKRRLGMDAPPANLLPANLGGGIIPQAVLLDTLAGFGHQAGGPLRPIIVVTYWRRRFTEAFTGVRVSLDTAIRSSMVAPELGGGERDLPLRGGVIEVKGPAFELPPTLRRISLLDVDWSRFSKYSHCIDAHLSQPGSVARLWPPGRVG